MSPSSILPLLLLAACVPRTASDPTERPRLRILSTRQAPPLVPVVAWSVDTTDLTDDEGHVRRHEWLGRMAVAMEAQLYRAVVPVGPGGRSPAVENSPTSETYQVVLTPHHDHRAEVSVCGPDGTCEIHFSSGSPEVIGTTLASSVLGQLRQHTPVLDCLVRPPSDDDYATLMTGRAAAVVYGWHAPSDAPGDPRLDPVARSVFLDPKSPTGQWLAGRMAWARGDADAAAAHLHFAAQRCPGHEGWAADEALAFALAGDRRGAFPDGDRFVFARLDAGLERQHPETYPEAIAAIQRWPDDPRLERRAADAAPAPKVEPHLLRWANLDPVDPVPVRRLARAALRDHSWRRLLELCDELERRGEETAHLRTPALLALGKVEAAAAAAPPELRARVAARNGAEPTGDSPEESLLAAERLLPTAPADALARCEEALERRPYWPEALLLAADAARAAGRPHDGYLARHRAVEP